LSRRGAEEGGDSVEIRLSLIGVGNIRDSHLAAIRAHPEYRVTAVCALTRDEVDPVARELGAAAFTDWRELLGEKPDVVLVSLPHGLHCEVSVAALEAGCHVMVEKPMAVSVAECNGMLRAARRSRRVLMVTESATFTPGALRTGEGYRSGELGRFLAGSIVNERAYFTPGRPAWFLDPAMSGGGMFSNVGLHRLAVSRSCLPGLRPEAVAASVSRVTEHPVEACTAAIVTYEGGGAMLYEEVGYFPRPGWLNTGTHFIFENGIVSWDEKTWRMQPRSGPSREEPLGPTGAPYEPIYANMLKALRGEDYGPRAEEYAMDTAIAQAAYASSRERRRVSLDEPEWRIE
jgi:predicted dehydrogenase